MLAAIEDETAGAQTGGREVKDSAPTDATLSEAAVADLAQEMCIPEELFRMVIERYPELNRVLARRYRPSTCTA